MALHPCPECGKEISDKAKTCPFCGASLLHEDSEAKVICPECGSIVPDDAEACPTCGCPIEHIIEAQKAVDSKTTIDKSASSTATDINEGPQPTSSVSKSKMVKIAAAVIAVLAVIFGVSSIAKANKEKKAKEEYYNNLIARFSMSLF